MVWELLENTAPSSSGVFVGQALLQVGPALPTFPAVGTASGPTLGSTLLSTRPLPWSCLSSPPCREQGAGLWVLTARWPLPHLIPIGWGFPGCWLHVPEAALGHAHMHAHMPRVSGGHHSYLYCFKADGPAAITDKTLSRCSWKILDADLWHQSLLPVPTNSSPPFVPPCLNSASLWAAPSNSCLQGVRIRAAFWCSCHRGRRNPKCGPYCQSFGPWSLHRWDPTLGKPGGTPSLMPFRVFPQHSFCP